MENIYKETNSIVKNNKFACTRNFIVNFCVNIVVKCCAIMRAVV